MKTSAKTVVAANRLSSSQTKSKTLSNQNSIAIWNYDHLLVKLIDSYSILESEASIQLQQKDFLISFVINMMKTYCSPKNQNPDESLAEFYFRYVKERYQVKVQVAKMCNALAYSMQAYAKTDQEIKFIFDFFGVNAALQFQISVFLKVRETIVAYLANVASIENVNLEVEQWSALLNRLFLGSQDSKRAILDKIKNLRDYWPQRQTKFLLKATQLLELCVEELTASKYSRPKSSGSPRQFMTTESSGRPEASSAGFGQFKNKNHAKGQGSSKRLDTEPYAPFTSYRQQTEGYEKLSPRMTLQEDGDYYRNTVPTAYDQYQEYEERDPNHRLKVSEAYQIEDLKRDRAYLKHEISKTTAVRNESREKTIQVLELYGELMTKHQNLIQFTEEVQKQMSYLLSLVKNKDKDLIKAVDPDVAKRFLSFKIEWPRLLELNDPELSKLQAQTARNNSPGQKKKSPSLTEGQFALLEITKPEPTILMDFIKEAEADKGPKASGAASKKEKAALVNEALSKVYDKALKNEQVMANRLRERYQRAQRLEAQRNADLQLEYATHGYTSIQTEMEPIDFSGVKLNKDAPTGDDYLRKNMKISWEDALALDAKRSQVLEKGKGKGGESKPEAKKSTATKAPDPKENRDRKETKTKADTGAVAEKKKASILVIKEKETDGKPAEEEKKEEQQEKKEDAGQGDEKDPAKSGEGEEKKTEEGVAQEKEEKKEGQSEENTGHGEEKAGVKIGEESNKQAEGADPNPKKEDKSGANPYPEIKITKEEVNNEEPKKPQEEQKTEPAKQEQVIEKKSEVKEEPKKEVNESETKQPESSSTQGTEKEEIKSEATQPTQSTENKQEAPEKQKEEAPAQEGAKNEEPKKEETPAQTTVPKFKSPMFKPPNKR